MPTYNIEQYLRQCLDSVVNQTYTNLEIIIIDDNSTDSTPDIIREYTAKDSRIKAVFHQSNAGPGSTRNEGLKLATGDYVTLMDHDDWQDLDKYEKMMANAQEQGTDIVFCNALEYDQYSQKTYVLYKKPKKFPERQRIDLTEMADKQAALQTYLPPWAKIVRLSMVRDVQAQFSLEGNKSDDILFHYQVVLAANSISYVNDPMYVHRFFAESISGRDREKSPSMVEDRFQTWGDIEVFCRRYNFEEIKVLAVFLKEFAIYGYRAPNSVKYIKRAQEIIRSYGLTEDDIPETHKTYYRRIMYYWWGRRLHDRIRRYMKLRIRAFKSKPLAN